MGHTFPPEMPAGYHRMGLRIQEKSPYGPDRRNPISLIKDYSSRKDISPEGNTEDLPQQEEGNSAPLQPLCLT